MSSLGNGNFVITWDSRGAVGLGGQDGSNSGVYGQVFDPTGNKIGGEFRVNSVTIGDQMSSSVTSLTDGGFVVTWKSYKGGDDHWKIRGQRFNAEGKKIRWEFEVKTSVNMSHFDPQVVSVGDGFAAIWASQYGQFGMAGDSHGKVYTLPDHSHLTTINENPASNGGDTIESIIKDGSILDPDGAAVEALAVISVDNTNGQWQFSTNNGISWETFTTTSGRVVELSTASRLLGGSNPDHKMRFVPNLNWSGQATFQFRAWDKTSGTPGGTSNTIINGWTTAFSAATDSATITVTASNDATVVADKVIAPVLPDYDNDFDQSVKPQSDGKDLFAKYTARKGNDKVITPMKISSAENTVTMPNYGPLPGEGRATENPSGENFQPAEAQLQPNREALSHAKLPTEHQQTQPKAEGNPNRPASNNVVQVIQTHAEVVIDQAGERNFILQADISLKTGGDDSQTVGERGETTPVKNAEIVDKPNNGTISFDKNGKLSYIPEAGFEGTDSFTLEVSDGKGGFLLKKVTIDTKDVKVTVEQTEADGDAKNNDGTDENHSDESKDKQEKESDKETSTTPDEKHAELNLMFDGFQKNIQHIAFQFDRDVDSLMEIFLQDIESKTPQTEKNVVT